MTSLREYSLYFVICFIATCVGAASFSADAFGEASDERTVNEAPATNNPVLESQSRNFTIRPGDTIELECVVRDLGDYVLVWKMGQSKLIFVGNLKVSRDDRHTKVQNNLQIAKVTKDDEGEYICQIPTNPLQEISYHIRVSENAPPSSSPGSKGGWNPITGSSIMTSSSCLTFFYSILSALVIMTGLRKL